MFAHVFSILALVRFSGCWGRILLALSYGLGRCLTRITRIERIRRIVSPLRRTEARNQVKVFVSWVVFLGLFFGFLCVQPGIPGSRGESGVTQKAVHDASNGARIMNGRLSARPAPESAEEHPWYCVSRPPTTQDRKQNSVSAALRMSDRSWTPSPANPLILPIQSI
jgi:hypothetical protein